MIEFAHNFMYHQETFVNTIVFTGSAIIIAILLYGAYRLHA